MPITGFLDGSSYLFDSEARRVMGVAYQMVRAALYLRSENMIADEVIANKIIELANEGERDPMLCEETLNYFQLHK